MSSESDQGDATRLVRQHLTSLYAAGIRQLPRPERSDAVAVTKGPTDTERSTDTEAPQARAQSLAESPQSSAIAAATSLFDQAEASHAESLPALQAEVAACASCSELAATRTQTVFGTGDPHARLCLLGEAPGADEDRQGEPFVGRSGQLLTKILAACNLRREDVYILNILKCRPPNNRNPTPDESNNCRRFLNRQLQLIDPEFICCLGAVAAQNLLDTTQSIGRLRGAVHNYRGIKVVCTYHPAYLLRNPSAKKDTWNDMKRLMREMGTPVD